MFSMFHSFAEQMQPIIAPSPTTTTMAPTDSTSAAISMGVIFTYLIIVGLLVILTIVCTWIIFNKLGEKGWKSLIPIYSTWVFLKLGDKPGWWAILALIPIVNIAAAVFVAIAAYNIGLKLHKPGWYVVLYILISPIWYVILAFSKDASVHEHAAAASSVSEQSSDTPTQPTPPSGF